MLADSKMQILPTRALSLEISRAGKCESGLVRGSKVRGAAEEPRDVLREHIQSLARSVPSSNALGVGRENWEIPVPSRREFSPLQELELVCQLGMLRLIGAEHRCPFTPQTRAACAQAGRKMFVDAVRNKKLLILGPLVAAFREPDLFVAERLAVSGCSVLLVGRTIADVAVQYDECGPALRFSEAV